MDHEVIAMILAEPATRQWTREEYYRLAEEGWFEGQRVQLIDGEIIQMPPQGHIHFLVLDRSGKFLLKAFGNAHWIRAQAPLNIGDSDPEPDLAVCEHPMEDYTDHPTTALLVVEVSDATLRLDRRKAGLYASAKIPEYWIIDLQHHCVEVHRRPVADLSAEFGWRYVDRVVVEGDDGFSPLARPDVKIKPADLLP
jgi:Uma2 family endonuclease